MEQRAKELLNQHKINVFVGTQIKKYEELSSGLLNNSLSASVNYCDQ